MINAIAPLLPLKTGIAVYSDKLYRHISKYMTIEILANKGSKSIYKTEKNMKIIESWDYNSYSSAIRLLGDILKKRRPCIHLQLGYTWIKNPIFTIIASTLILLLLKLVRHTRTVVTLHGLVLPETLRTYALMLRKPFLSTLYRILTGVYLIFYRILLKISDKIIVHNRLIKNKLIEIVGKYGSEKVVIIPHGVDLEYVEEPKDDLENSEPLISLIGFIRKNKGIEEFLDAVEHVKKVTKKKFHALIAGPLHIRDDPNYISELIRSVKEKNIDDIVSVRIGFHSESVLNEILSKTSIIVLPYKDFFYEASGVLARIMSFNVALVCTAIPKFLSEIKPGRDAIVVPPGNSRSLAKAIKILIERAEIRKKLARNLRKNAFSRSWHHVAMQHIRLYYKLLSKKK